MNKQLLKQLEDMLSRLLEIIGEIETYQSRITSNKYQELESVKNELQAEYKTLFKLIYGK